MRFIAIIQIAGAALIGTSESDTVSGKVPPITPQQANDILIAGLATQVGDPFKIPASVH